MRDEINKIAKEIFQANATAGWWNDLVTGRFKDSPSDVAEKLLLIHSEVSEATEGFRKNLPDDKLHHRSMFETELADIFIRLLDLAGGLGVDIGGAVEEKFEYNKSRDDHKVENRKLQNGKKF